MSNFSAALAHIKSNPLTTFIGAAIALVGVAGYFGVPLPVVQGVQLNSHDLLVYGLTALGLIAAKDAAK